MQKTKLSKIIIKFSFRLKRQIENFKLENTYIKESLNSCKEINKRHEAEVFNEIAHLKKNEDHLIKTIQSLKKENVKKDELFM